MNFLRWLRQLVCIHGPTERVNFGYYYADACSRCGKITMRYWHG